MWTRAHKIALSGLLAGAGVVAALGLIPAERAAAQLVPGEYSLHQDGLVGWVCVSADRTEEWWAYFQDTYVWGNPTHNLVNPWELSGAYQSLGTWGGYAAWKADVLQRTESLNRTIIFQRHFVTEEQVEN
jgi:hypothetical protein